MTARRSNARRAACGMTHAEIRDAATETHKHCTKCGELKPFEDFPVDQRGFKGRLAQCRQCWLTYLSERNQRPEVKANTRIRNAAPERKRKARLAFIRRRYGAAAVQVEERRLAGEPCDICGETLSLRLMAIDHRGSLVRGLLCRRCNTTLGHVEDKPELLQAMVAYLERG